MAEISRPIAGFTSNRWENPLVSFPLGNESEYEQHRERNTLLRVEVRNMLMSSTGNAIENIKLIDTLCRLGVSYHFRDEIEEQLTKMYDIHLNDITKVLDDSDLHTVALVFHTLRSHGFKMTSDVFKRFKRENDDKFDEAIATDARGMLSLYEAAQWDVPGEEILDEAIAFSKPRLESLAASQSPRLGQRIMEVLEWPYHKDMPRIHERRFISFYEEEEEMNHTLLEFAKLDYKLLQQMYRQELHCFYRWFQDLNLTSELPYARSRTVEAYIWGTGSYFEPQYSHARLLFAKVLVFCTFVNDTYDAYGTIDELTTFTDATQKWEVSEELPDYMKTLCRAVFNFYNETQKELTQLNKPQAFVYAKTAWKRLVEAYFQKAKWLHQAYTPTLEEMLKTETDLRSCQPILSASAAAMGTVDLAAVQWLAARPKVVVSLELIGRLLNDLRSHKFERKRRHSPSTVECYMNQYDVTEEEAVKELEELVRQKRKEFNGDFMRPNPVPRPLIQSLLDMLRTTDLFYKYDDAFTRPEFMNAYIKKLLVDDISI